MSSQLFIRGTPFKRHVPSPISHKGGKVVGAAAEHSGSVNLTFLNLSAAICKMGITGRLSDTVCTDCLVGVMVGIE